MGDWLKRFSLLIAIIALSACSGDSSFGGDNNTGLGGGGGGTGGIGSGNVAEVVLTIGSEQLIANGADATIIRACTLDDVGLALSGETVSFSITAGSLSASSATTDSTGCITVTLTSAVNLGSTSVTAASGGFRGIGSVEFIAGTPASISMVADSSSVAQGDDTTVQVSLFDANSNPIEGETVSFSIATVGSGTPQLSILTAKTDVNGRAETVYTAGTAVGNDVVQVSTTNGTSASTTLTVSSSGGGSIGGLSKMSITLGSESLIANGTDSTFVRACTFDESGAGITAQTVSFVTTAGALSSNSGSTDSSGCASVTLTAASNLGTASVSVSSGGFQVIGVASFVAGAPNAINIAPSSLSVAPGGESVLRVALVDASGNPVSGETVTFSISATNTGSPSLSTLNVITDANGRAESVYTGGSSAGTDTVQVETTSGSVQATANIVVSTSVVVAGELTLSSGSGDIVADGFSSSSLTAKVLSSNGSPMQGVMVSFITNAGTLSAATAVTDAGGYASVTLVSTTLVGTAAITAGASGLNDSLDINFVAGSPATVTTSATSLTVVPSGTAVVTAQVLDGRGNPVEGETVTFNISTVATGSPTIATIHVKTDANGRASSNYTAGSITATDVVSTTTTNGSTGSVSITVDPTVVVVGDVVLFSTSTELVADVSNSTLIRATVTDINGSVVVGRSIGFTSTAGTLSAASAITDSSGIANVTLTASNSVANAAVSAQVAGFNPVLNIPFIPGNPVLVNSTISASPASLPADGTSLSEIIVLLVDANGNQIKDGSTVTLNSDLGAIISGNPSVTTLGRSVFSLQAPNETGSATLTVSELPSLTRTVTFGSTSSGDPANIEVSVSDSTVFVSGVGKNSNSTISIQVSDDVGDPIDEAGYGNSALDNLRITLITQPHGGEYISATNASGATVNTLPSAPILARTTDGSITLNFQSGILPGVIEAKVEVLYDASGALLADPIVAVLPQLTVASGPPHAIALSTSNTDAITVEPGGLYSRIGSVIVTDRYGNSVPDGTAVSLGLLDTVLAFGADGQTAAASQNMTSVTANFTAVAVIRNGVARGIEVNDRIILETAISADKARFVESVSGPTDVVAQRAYTDSRTGLEYVVGASTLGGEVFGISHEDGSLIAGTAYTKEGFSNIRVRYPANNNNVGIQKGSILVGCYGYAANVYSTDDKRYDQPQSAQVYLIASATDGSTTTVNRQTFCFQYVAGGTLTPSIDVVSSDATIALGLLDGGDKIELPFVGIGASSAVVSRPLCQAEQQADPTATPPVLYEPEVYSSFDVVATVLNNPENGKPQTNIGGVATATLVMTGECLDENGVAYPQLFPPKGSEAKIVFSSVREADVTAEVWYRIPN